MNVALAVAAASLSLGAAIALGLARFSYALLLPAMKADLGWTFAQAGALNTANAAGYLAGALVMPLLSRRFHASQLFMGGALLATLGIVATGFTTRFEALLAIRMACGVFSAIIFVAGGVLATRLAAAHPRRAGLVLGAYYGGTGWGIILSALVVPFSVRAVAHGWQAAWLALGLVSLGCSLLAWPSVARVSSGVAARPEHVAGEDPRAPGLGRASRLLVAYGLFGIGYIGYMTFVIALLRGAGMGSAVVTTFFVALGLATAASGGVWARVLTRAQGGGAFACCCVLLSVAVLLPALSTSRGAIFASGILFGGTFLAVVTSTTAFVRHNLPPARWPAGISAFTIVFAAGQIAGPVVMGRVADGTGLSRGFLYSSEVLLLASVIALGQRSLAPPLGAG